MRKHFIDNLRWMVILLLVPYHAAQAFNVWMFIWSGRDFGVANTIAKAFAEWFMILALIGVGKRSLDFSGKTSSYLSQRSFPFFSSHFLCSAS